jgi:hypothetical protein
MVFRDHKDPFSHLLLVFDDSGQARNADGTAKIFQQFDDGAGIGFVVPLVRIGEMT